MFVALGVFHEISTMFTSLRVPIAMLPSSCQVSCAPREERLLVTVLFLLPVFSYCQNFHGKETYTCHQN